MNRLSLLKALVRKEWLQNRLLFAAALIVMSMHPTISSIFYWLDRPNRMKPLADWSASFSLILYQHDGAMLALLGWIFAIAIAIRLLADERIGDTLDFLVALPLGRRSIAAAKYMLGAAVIIAIILLNMLFFLIMPLFLPVYYQLSDAVKWFLLTGSLLLAIYSTSFWVATVTGNRAGGYTIAFLLLLLPKLAYAVISFCSFGLIGPAGLDRLSTLTDHLTLLHYLTNVRAYLHSPLYVWLLLTLLAICIAFFYLSLVCFERNRLENNGEFFIFSFGKSVEKRGRGHAALQKRP